MRWLLVLFLVKAILAFEHDFKGFDDSILFKINWPGSQENINILDNINENVEKQTTPEANEVLTVKTINKEKYQCHLPNVRTTEPSKIEDYEGPNPIDLLKPLFSQKICSYRLESYWSYEVCHGRYIRQYHEEKDGKTIKLQEFFLGHWSVEKQKKLETAQAAAKESREKPKLTKVQGIPLPSVEMVMEEGTICDLSGNPRLTRVQYVCYSHGKHEVYSFKETSTCEYEIIILSPLLCDHPQFVPHETTENEINCLPVGDAPKKPRGLLTMEAESLKMQHQTFRLAATDGETHLKFELHHLPQEPEGAEKSGKVLPQISTDKYAPLTDDSPVRSFLNGETCLQGGVGWWKHEFCYGKQVTQYHIDRSGQKTTVLLGKFNEQNHIDWVRENRFKAPKPLDQRTSISHFYSDGDVCEVGGKTVPRQTEVKLKCPENTSISGQMSIYLLEPKTCHYILGVEASLICDILPLADENGLIKQPLQIPPKSEVSGSKDEDNVQHSVDNVDDVRN